MAFTPVGHSKVISEIKNILKNNPCPRGYTLGFHGSLSNFNSFSADYAENEFGFHFAADYFGTEHFTKFPKKKVFKIKYLYVCALPIKEKITYIPDRGGKFSIRYISEEITRKVGIRKFFALDDDLETFNTIEDLAFYTNYQTLRKLLLEYLEKENINCIEYYNVYEEPIGEKVYMMLDVDSTIDDIIILGKVEITPEDNDER